MNRTVLAILTIIVLCIIAWGLWSGVYERCYVGLFCWLMICVEDFIFRAYLVAKSYLALKQRGF
jgi:hypothetical protein